MTTSIWLQGVKDQKKTTTANPLELYNAQNVDLLTNSKLEYDRINKHDDRVWQVFRLRGKSTIIRVGQNSEIKEIELI